MLLHLILLGRIKIACLLSFFIGIVHTMKVLNKLP